MTSDGFLSFPKDFLWSACLSDYQHFGGSKCDLPLIWTAKHSMLYQKDFELIAKLKLKAFRTGIEWARIEPKEGDIDKEAVKFYHDYFNALKQKEVKTFVTLHHFTNPAWIHDHGGWLSKKIVEKFVEYVDFVSSEFGEYIDYYVVINEPAVYAYNSYMTGEAGFPPHHSNMNEVLPCTNNLIEALTASYKVIHKNDKNANVGFSNFISIFVPENPSDPDNVQMCEIANNTLIYLIPDALKDKMDYMGIDYYLNVYLSKKGSVTKSEIHPEGLRRYLKEFHEKYQKPIAIIENGFPTRDEKMKIKFMLDHLKQVHDAIKEDGVNVFAYNWWSFLHGYEWSLGYSPFFALIDVDIDKTLKRKVTETTEIYTRICKQNGFSRKLYETYHKLPKKSLFKVKPTSPFAFQP
jgi:beta-glucosidase